jgi:hypothetical protein
MFAQYWVRDAGTASLALSATTATMAMALIPASMLADRLGRRRLIVGALLITAALGMLLPFTQVWWQLITLRTLMGITLAGIPAVAMVYLSEEMDPEAPGLFHGPLYRRHRAGRHGRARHFRRALRLAGLARGHRHSRRPHPHRGACRGHAAAAATPFPPRSHPAARTLAPLPRQF